MMQIRYGRYVGRVGALAVALGIGSAVAAPAGIAWATPGDSATSPSAPGPSSESGASTAGSAGADGTTGTSTHESANTNEPAEQESGSVDTESTSGTDTATPDDTSTDTGDVTTDDATDAADAGTPKSESKKKSTLNTHARLIEPDTTPAEPSRQVVAQDAPDSAPAQDVADTTAKTIEPVVVTQQPAAAVPVALPVAIQPPLQALVSSQLTDVISPVLSSLLGVLPGGPVDSPLALLVLAAARKQTGTAEDSAAARVAATQTVAAVVANLPPTATVTFGRPDATTGTVLGQLVTSDPEGKKVAVALTSAPAGDALAYNAKTGVITYTPSSAQRFTASMSSNPNDTIEMTLTVTDGVNSVVVPVNIPVSPAPFYKASEITNTTGPSAVAATSTRAYIANRATGTITVVDTVGNTVVGTYQAGLAPDGIAIKADGTRLYVSSSTNNTVTVIDTATGNTKATITVANPTAITINPSGSTVYIASSSTAKIAKISTSTNKVIGTVTLAAGLTPVELAVSADGKKIYVASRTAAGGGNLSVVSSTGTKTSTVADIAGAPTGLVVSSTYPTAFISSVDGTLTMVDTSTGATVVRNFGMPLSGVAITKDGSAVFAVSSSGLVAGLNTAGGAMLGVVTLRDSALPPISVQPGVALSTDATQLLVTDYDTNSVHVISLVPPNFAPFSSDPVNSISNPTTGALTGRVGVVDFDGDPLTYVVTSKPTKGALVLNANGTYTYTPTATARHAAAVPGALSSVTTDSFTVTVSDGRNGSVTTTIPLPIAPKNAAPVVSTTIGSPSATTGVVKGSVTATDGDADKRIYVAGAPAKGTVSITSAGVFTYTPTLQARSAATALGATREDKQDAFTVTVDDGHGGVVAVTVNVKIGAPNSKPTGATATANSPDPRTGVVTGVVAASDANGDALTYTANKTTKGAVVINPDGSFTYTPTVAARLAASAPKAATATKSETITFTVADGFGGTTTASLKVSITSNPLINAAPTNGHGTVQDTSTAIGTVTGIVTGDDADGDRLTYTLGSGPAFGTATVTSAGRFTYTPDVDSRYRALVTPGVDTDSFTVTISDGFGGTSTATVNVTIAPPSASAIDQRPTTVGVATQQMYFYSQVDTDRAMGLLKDAGVDTIRIMLPWAGVEPEDNSFDWDAVDRMVNSANANGIKVLATVNATPDWAAVPGQPQYIGAPADLDGFRDFISAVATRYQGKVADYEIWNEPNANVFWSPHPDAAKYTELLKVAYTAIKAADPDAVVIAASVAAFMETPGGPAINPVTFLSQMYAAGAGGYFDAIAFHPYLYSLLFSDGAGHAGVPITQAEQLHAVMVANGDGNKKIWATEYGEPTSVVSEATQALFIGDFLRTWRTLDYAGPAFIHTLADYQISDPVEATYGLFREDWTPKPALGTVTQVIAENAAINAAADNEVL